VSLTCRALFPNGVERLGAVGRFDRAKAVGPKRCREDAPVHPLVIDDENCWHVMNRGSRQHDRKLHLAPRTLRRERSRRSVVATSAKCTAGAPRGPSHSEHLWGTFYATVFEDGVAVESET